MEHECVNQIFPSWQIWSDLFADARERALGLDALDSTHALRPEGLSLAEISQQFDFISYEKGGNIIKMASHLIGNQNFKDGLHRYFFLHGWENAESHDLWTALSEFIVDPTLEPETFVEMMESWTFLPGFPLLEVTLNDKGDEITVKQSRYFHKLPKNAKKQLWQIPIQIGTTDPLNPPETIIQTKETAHYPWNNSISGVLINPFGAGYYRVRYHDSLWNMIVTQLQVNLDIFSPMQRAVLLSDAIAFSLSDKLAPTDFLQFSRFLNNEKHFLVWEIALQGFYKWDYLLRNQPNYSYFQVIS